MVKPVFGILFGYPPGGGPDGVFEQVAGTGLGHALSIIYLLGNQTCLLCFG
jgi:hypothetical protein